jgi:monovalent cation:proton antiporter-2 (CPA2) family protein
MTTTNYLVDILILLAVAVIAVPLFQRLRLGSVVGYLAAGAVVGPWGFGFIDEVEEIRHIAEFGVVFLLFIIGIEIKPTRLWAMRRTVFGLGTAQVVLTGLAIAGVAYFVGQSLKVAIIVGFGLALSSTAFGLQILNERGEVDTGHGRVALSVLLLQDLAVVPLLTLISLLAAENVTLVQGIEFAILEALLVIALVVLAGRFLLSPILKLAATSRAAEVFTAAAVFAVLGTAWLMETAGLSLALGAFLAGLMMADSHYRHQVIADIDPFRGILLGLFFMGVGMSVDFGLLGEHWVLISGLVLGLLAAKFAIMWGLSRLMRVQAADATRASFLLSQSGEFGFVIFGLAAINGLLTDDLFRFLVLLVALTMVATPLLPILGEYFAKRFDVPPTSHDLTGGQLDAEPPQVIIAGYGRVGRRVATILEAANIRYLAIENDAERVLKGRHEGHPVFYGDASQVELLKTAGAENVHAIVCTLNQPVPAVRMIKILRQQYPNIAIHARGQNHFHCEELLEAGATVAVSVTLEASLQLGGEALKSMGVKPDDAFALLDSFRNTIYK